jgi:hypothetical protein
MNRYPQEHLDRRATSNSSRRGKVIASAFALAWTTLLIVPSGGRGAPAPGKSITWKPIRDAIFKMDEKPVRGWNLFHAEKEKKEHRLLLKLGSRYLMFNAELRQIVEYDPAGFTPKGDSMEMARDAKPLKTVPTEDWILRDAGATSIIHAKLKEEGRVVEIQLPKLPDLRGILW